MNNPDKVRVTTFVAVSPSDAFEVFTQETDLWWRKGPRYRYALKENGVLRFEGTAGGRLVETYPGGEAFEAGRILIWEPGRRLVFEWRARNFTPEQRTEVEIRFEPKNEGTEVILEHRGWAALPAKHPARHGMEGDAFTAMIGIWWGELVTSFRQHSASRRGSARSA